MQDHPRITAPSSAQSWGSSFFHYPSLSALITAVSQIHQAPAQCSAPQSAIGNETIPVNIGSFLFTEQSIKQDASSHASRNYIHGSAGEKGWKWFLSHLVYPLEHVNIFLYSLLPLSSSYSASLQLNRPCLLVGCAATKILSVGNIYTLALERTPFRRLHYIQNQLQA